MVLLNTVKFEVNHNDGEYVSIDIIDDRNKMYLILGDCFNIETFKKLLHAMENNTGYNMPNEGCDFYMMYGSNILSFGYYISQEHFMVGYDREIIREEAIIAVSNLIKDLEKI